MTQAIAVIISIIIIRSLYYRYVPTSKVKERDINQTIEKNEATILDIRDFNVSYRDPISNAVNIPFSYLNRYHHELGSNPIVIISPDTVGKNMSTRFLKRKGYSVIGFHIKENSLLESNKRKEEVAS